jgi:hypothetical protein
MKPLTCVTLVLHGAILLLSGCKAFLGNSIVKSRGIKAQASSHRQIHSVGLFGQRIEAISVRPTRRSMIVSLQVKKKLDLDDKDNQKESSSPTKATDKMAETPKKDLFVFDNIRIWDKVSDAVAATAWGFLAIGFLLNVFGYDFLMRNGSITVDTLEKAQFEKEINRVMKKNERGSHDEIGMKISRSAPTQWNDGDAQSPRRQSNSQWV